jgi:CheY-like chemotaxis protein
LKLAETETEQPAGTRAKILVVDDEQTVRNLLKKVLAEEGHDVETVDNANDALEMLQTGRYGLILLDVKMPGMSGPELYRNIEKIARSLARRVLFVTGDVMGPSTQEFLNKTKARHINKPFDVKLLKKTVNQMLAEGG